MRLYVTTKAIALSGALMAINVILIVLSGVFEWNTLFLLALAAFITGIVSYCFQTKIAVLFLFGCFFLGLFLAPNKFYCITFFCFGGYVLVSEYYRKRRIQGQPVGKGKEWLGKILAFHLFLGILLGLMYFIFGFESISSWKMVTMLKNQMWLLVLVLMILAEVCFFIFDRAYNFFQDRYGYIFIQFISDEKK